MYVPTVREVMTRSVETVTPDVAVRVAASRLREHDIGSLVVVENGHPVGIVTSTDFVTVVAAGGDGDAVAVGDMMSDNPVTIGPEAVVTVAAHRLAEHAITKLPVVEDGSLVGIVTATDLTNYVSASAMVPDEPVERQRHRYRPDTAYEREDWSFQSYGTEDGLDVGDRVSFSKTITTDDIEAFAEASGDTNRVHLEADFAAETRFGEQIAHGALVTGLVSAALARLPGLIIYLSQQVTYLAPVTLGERVTANCTVVESLGPNRYRLTTTVETESGTTVIEGQATVLADPLPEA
jgi:acyl dehydratase/CBS domain-containing protein